MTARRAIEPDDADRPGFLARHKGTVAVVVALVVLVGGGGGAWLFARQALSGALSGLLTPADYPGPGGAEVIVEIPRGASLTRIGEILTEAGVVASTGAFTRAVAAAPEATSIQAGTFRLRAELPAATALAMLLDPANAQRAMFTLREGNWLSDHVQAMADTTGLDPEEFERVLMDTDELALPGWAEGTAEGFLFPDSYELPDPPDAAATVRLATDRFSEVAGELDLAARAQELGITPYEALIVASIIEREAGRAEDRPKVARVIYNRLDQDMLLQLDSTVAYAAGKQGTVWTTAEERDSDSEYNTYKHTGLPIGPISSPGRAALEAAVSPAEGDWLFFVPVNLETGETVFTSTYAEHQEAVARLHEWCAASPENKAKCS